MIVFVHAQGSTVTPTPGSGEDDPVSERKYKENFYASVSPTIHHDWCANPYSTDFALHCRCMKY